MLPEEYEQVSEEIVSDIFYLNDLSNRGRVTLIRQYTEILCRILLNITDHFYLGKFKKRLEIELPNAILVDEINKHIENLVRLGNAATHLDKDLQLQITEEDCKSALDSLNFVISYLFINYFTKYPFGSHPQTLQILSLLPPFIRVTILINLYQVYPKNIALIDKLALALLKAKGKDAAYEWLEQEKENLLVLSNIEPCPIEEKYRILTEQGIPREIIPQYIQYIEENETNMYISCLEKLNLMENHIQSYKTFEEAKTEYFSAISTINSNIDTLDNEVKEFINLMDFVYIGRKYSKS